MASRNHQLNIVIIIIASISLWMTTATIALTRSTTDLEEFTESTESVSTLAWQTSSEMNNRRTEETPEDNPFIVTIGNLSFPICPEHHVCLERSCNATHDTNQACYCDEECTFFGDCCPKSLSKDDPDCDLNKNMDLPSLYDYDRSQFTCEKLGSDKNPRYYYLVSKCPSAINEQIRVKCEAASSSSSIFSVESIPLSLENIVSYRNVYCAICNGQDPQTLTPWSVSMECPEDITNELKNNIRTVEDVLRNQICAVDVEPPASGKAVRGCLLGTYQISYYVDTCPLSSDWSLQLACANITANFFQHNTECVGYKNPACYACTFGHFPDLNNICIDQCSPGIDSFPNTQTLSVLFDFSSESGVRIVEDGIVVIQTAVVCRPGEFYDPYVGSCIRLSCPQGYEMIGSECAGEASADDLTCRLLTSRSNKVVTATIVTNYPGMCASFGSRKQSCNIDSLVQALHIQSLLECKENERGGQYETVFIWEMEEDYQASGTINDIDSMRSVISDNITNYEVCNISFISIYSQCKPDPLGNEDICTKVYNNNFTLATVTAANGDDEAVDTRPRDVFKVLETRYVLIPNRSDIVQNVSMFTCNLTATELVCPSAIFNTSLFIHLGDDGMLQYEPSGDVIYPSEYVSLGDGTIRACQFLSQNGTVNETTRYTFFHYSSTQTTLSLSGTALSLASLFITLVSYTIFSSLRRLVSNQLIMALCGTLFVAQCLLLFGGWASSVSQHLCTALAAISHFFWLNVFTLSSSLAFDLRRTFGTSKTLRVSSTSRKNLALYISVATGIPLVIVGISLALSFFIGDNIDLHYGDELACWVGGGQANLLAFGVPVLVLLVFNISCFLDTVRGISRSKKDGMALHEGTENLRYHQELLKIAIKISSLMCFTWLCGFIAAFSKQQAVWYIFIIINSLQGVYIFLAFAATRRVYQLWRGLLLGKRGVDTRSRDYTLQLRDRSTSSSVLKTSI